jgi:hypothetical protein
MFYDMDTSPARKKASPDFWGVVPERGRSLAFTMILWLSCLQALSKALSLSLIYVTNSSWCAYYVLIDYGCVRAQNPPPERRN